MPNSGNNIELISPALSSGLKRTGRSNKGNDKELEKACRAFEEVFLRTILKEAHINRGLFDSKNNQLYGDMATENLAKAMSQAGGIGLAETLYRQLSENLNVQLRSSEVNTIQNEGSE